MHSGLTGPQFQNIVKRLSGPSQPWEWPCSLVRCPARDPDKQSKPIGCKEHRAPEESVAESTVRTAMRHFPTGKRAAQASPAGILTRGDRVYPCRKKLKGQMRWPRMKASSSHLAHGAIDQHHRDAPGHGSAGHHRRAKSCSSPVMKPQANPDQVPHALHADIRQSGGRDAAKSAA